MKRIYFIRHGESEANVAKIHGFGDALLTKRGRAQAEDVAERVSKLPIEAIVASSMDRARDTAEAMARKLKLPYETSDLFVECRGPQQIMGKAYTDPDGMSAVKQMTKSFAQGYRFDDEENFDDLKERGNKALAFLAQKQESHIIVTTHGLFLRILIASALFGADMSARECRRCMDGFGTQNTGLTIFDYKATDYAGETSNNSWRIWVYNDHSHLTD
jgi:broad specificity phosphatase PhoE